MVLKSGIYKYIGIIKINHQAGIQWWPISKWKMVYRKFMVCIEQRTSELWPWLYKMKCLLTTRLWDPPVSAAVNIYAGSDDPKTTRMAGAPHDLQRTLQKEGKTRQQKNKKQTTTTTKKTHHRVALINMQGNPKARKVLQCSQKDLVSFSHGDDEVPNFRDLDCSIAR